MTNNVNAAVEYTTKQIGSYLFKIEHRTSPQHFTRESDLGFKNTALLILRLIKKSLKAELMDYFYQHSDVEKIPSRQAFSQAREKLSYLAFKDFFEKTCELAVDNGNDRLYKGYRIFAVDGTVFAVGDLTKLSSYFGATTTIKDKAMCRINAIVDVLNDCIVNASVSPFCVGERALAIDQIKQLEHVRHALFLFDRGYWSPVLAATIMQGGQKFLMRLPSNVHNIVVKDADGNVIPLRRYTFVLPGGDTEILLTNIAETEMSDDELAALYTRRWGVETKYLELKDRLQINKLSGESINTVLQDIYATMYVSNLVAFMCYESDEAIKAREADKNNLYKQKTNRTTCISTFRRRFIDICLILDTPTRNDALKRLYQDISKDVVYIGKSKPRPRNVRQIKASRLVRRSSVL